MTPLEVLIVDDNRGDVVLLREAIRQAALNYRVHVVRDGVEAVDYLHRRGEYGESRRPDLILLDLKLPRKNGREVLDEIRPDDSLWRIPLVALSSSASELEHARASGLPAERCLAKPDSYEGYVALVRDIDALRQRAAAGELQGSS
ncbi:MAG: response regulator [Candidatus Krumholzibacteria bacterium]|nr:response regulator [Candidatus Krumholzibacteria bacterium]